MSGSSEKVVRRELRRAIGDEALKHIDAHSAALDHHTINMDALHVEVKQLRALSKEHADRLTTLERRADSAAMLASGQAASLALMRDFRARRFFQRLLWILTGR